MKVALEARVTLPDGARVDVSHFAEYDGWTPSIGDGYLQAKRVLPLFTTTIEAFLEEKLGSDWAHIIRMEDQLHQLFLPKIEGAYERGYKEGESVFDAIARWSSIAPNYRLWYLGKNGHSHVFRYQAWNLDPQDGGNYSYTFAVRPSIIVERAKTSEARLASSI